MRGAGRGRPVSAVRAVPASGPETRTIATPPRPGAVAGAKMVGTRLDLELQAGETERGSVWSGSSISRSTRPPPTTWV